MSDKMVLNKDKKKVVVAMSGGVDSSVTALLLAKQGYNVVGLHMTNMNEQSEQDDRRSVESLCKKLGIDCEFVTLKDEMQSVMDYFFSEYENGRTPNPCVICNKTVKFKPFIDFAKKIGADYFATGHYAKILHTKDGDFLMVARDENKDQTYFLNGLSNEQLKMALFPLGELKKDEVRKIAEENNLYSAHKKDSQDICFLGSEKFKDFMTEHHISTPGKIVDVSTGKLVGKHGGLDKYTIGQRRGLGIGGGSGKTGEAWFVCNKDTKTNTLFVEQGNGESLYSIGLKINNFNWINEQIETEFECLAKFRYRQALQGVFVKINDDKTVTINFKEKQRAITTGQFAVLYKKADGETYCLGGGAIDDVIYKEDR